MRNLLTREKEESETTVLKLNIQKTKITASSPITSRQIEGEKVEAVKYLIFLGSKITEHCDCCHEITNYFASWKESYQKPAEYIKKQRHHFDDKGPYSQSYGFSSNHVQM